MPGRARGGSDRRSLGVRSPFPVYFLTIALVKAVEAVGAALYTWAPGWISRRYGWYDVPPSGRPQVVGAE